VEGVEDVVEVGSCVKIDGFVEGKVVEGSCVEIDDFVEDRAVVLVDGFCDEVVEVVELVVGAA